MDDIHAHMKPEKPSAIPGAATSVESIAPEEHDTTGGKHMKQKKVLHESDRRKEAQPAPDQSAGQHRTGSFTGTTGWSGSRS